MHFVESLFQAYPSGHVQLLLSLSKTALPPYFIQQNSVFVTHELSFTTYPEIHLHDFDVLSYFEKFGQGGIVGLGVGVMVGPFVGEEVGVGVLLEQVQVALTVPSAQYSLLVEKSHP